MDSFFKVNIMNALPISFGELVGSVPAPIADLSAVALSDSIVFNWTRPNGYGSGVDSYILEYREVGAPSWISISGITATTTTVLSLSQATQYEARITAVNSVGSSRLSPTLSISTLSAPGLPGAITDLAGVAAPGEVALSWSAPAANGAAITGYRVEYRISGATTFTLFGDITGTSTTVNGLTAGLNYEFKVRSINSQGLGPDSNIPTVGTPRVADAPVITAVAGLPGEINLNWSAPADNGSAITGYRIEYREVGASSFLVAATTSATNFTISSLTEGQAYEVRVIAINGVGDSFPSNVETVTTSLSAAIPGAITDLSGIAAPGEVALSWSAPAANGAAITGYRVEYRITGAATYSLFGIVPGTSATVDELTAGLNYEFKVRAINSQGLGPDSNIPTVGTPRVADAPVITAVAGLPGEINLNWSAPADNGSAITGYRIEYREVGASSFLVAATTSATNLTVSSLTEGQAYEVRVIAINGVGDSFPSNVETVTTAITQTAPSAVGDLTATKTGTYGVSLRWNPPADGNSPITRYQILYRETASSSFTNSSFVSSPWATISNLKPSTSYTFQVVAINEIGSSPGSNLDTAQTDPLASGAAQIALFVVNTDLSVRDDLALRDFLVSQGHTVTLFSHTASAPDPSLFDFLIVSETVSTGQIAGEFLSWPKPVILMDRGIASQHQISNDNFANANGTQLQIAEPSHPLAAGLSGTVDIYTASAEYYYQQETDLRAGNFTAIANQVGTSANKSIILIEAGQQLFDGTVAPAARIMSHVGQDAFSELTTQGLALFAAQVAYFAPQASGSLGDGLSLVTTGEVLNNGTPVLSYDETGGEYTLEMSLSGLFNDSDDIGGIMKQIPGDFQAVLQVASSESSLNTAFSGLMVRESLAPGSRFIMAGNNAGSGSRRITRRETADTNLVYSGFTSGFDPNTYPEWYRITKVGNLYELQFSKDGINWIDFNATSQYTIDLGSNPYVGFVTSQPENTVRDFIVTDFHLINDDTYVPPSAPAQVENLSAGSIQQTQLSLSFQAPNNNGSPITSYLIQRKLATESSYNDSGNTSSTSAVITGLQESTQYDFRVAAINALGQGPFSEVLRVSTASPASSIAYACSTAEPPVFKEANLGGYAVCETRSVWRPTSGGNPQVVTISDLNPSTINAISNLQGNVIVIPLIDGIVNMAGSSLTMDWANGIFCGWCAPNSGYSIENGPLIIQDGAGNIVISHFGSRGGSQMGGQSDTISVRNENGFTVIDRVTATKAIDGTMEVERPNMRVDVRHCFFSRMLYKTSATSGTNNNNGGYHPEQVDGSNTAHNFGGLWGSNNSATEIYGTSYMNVLSDFRQRGWLWRGKADVAQLFDFIQNYGERAGRLLDAAHGTYYGCTWRTGEDGRTRWPGGHALAPLQADDPFNSGSGNTAYIERCEHIREGVDVTPSDQFGLFRSINSGRRASSWSHHGVSPGFETLPCVTDANFLGTGQTRIDAIVDAAGMKPLSPNSEDAAEKLLVKGNTSRMQIGEFQYSAASRNGSGQAITLADLGITLDGTEHDLQSNGRTRIENILLDLKNTREVQY